MPEPCPFCGKPIVREYGSFRCKHCAGSSEDLIDRERKARAAEVRKQTRVKPGVATLAPKAELVVPEPPRAPASATAKASAKSAAKLTSKPAKSAKSAAKAPPAPVVAPANGGAAPVRSTKSARLRMVTAAAARIAERKKAPTPEAAPLPAPAKKATRKGR